MSMTTCYYYFVFWCLRREETTITRGLTNTDNSLSLFQWDQISLQLFQPSLNSSTQRLTLISSLKFFSPFFVETSSAVAAVSCFADILLEYFARPSTDSKMAAHRRAKRCDLAQQTLSMPDAVRTDQVPRIVELSKQMNGVLSLLVVIKRMGYDR